jgi:hypothetical protein
MQSVWRTCWSQSVLLTVVTSPSHQRTCRLTVKNTGRRSAREYYWHVYIPIELTDHLNLVWSGNPDAIPQEDVPIETQVYRHYRDLSRLPVFPDNTVLLATIEVKPTAPNGQWNLLWRLQADDGAFPSKENTLGKFTLTT